MARYFKAEVLKLQHNHLVRSIWLFPLIGILVALGFSALGGTEILKLSDETIINHWSIIWINALIATLAGTIDRNEKKSTRYMIYSGRAVSLSSIELTRIGLIAVMSLISTFIVSVALILNSLWLDTPSITSLGNCLLAMVVIWLTTLWQIPFCLWMSRKTIIYIPIILNTLVPLLMGTSIATTDGWLIFPYSWDLRILMPITRMHINGIPLPANSTFLSSQSIPMGLILSLICFVVLSGLASWSFKRQEITK